MFMDAFWYLLGLFCCLFCIFEILWLCFSIWYQFHQVSNKIIKEKIVPKNKSQKQLSRGVLRKRCSEDMPQICRRTPVSKRDFNEVAWNHTLAWLFFCEFSVYFRNTFLSEHLRAASGRADSESSDFVITLAEAYLEPNQTCKMELFAKIDNRNSDRCFPVRNFQEHLFHRAPLVAASDTC